MTRLLVLSAVLILCDVAAADCSKHDDENRIYNENPSFDYLLFVQDWVPGFCATQREPCRVPGGKPRWTMHGLWPTSDGEKGPNYCFPYQFDINKIRDLVGTLNSSWPESFPDRPYYCLWKHEYEKHGTCASVLPQFKDQHDFFSGVLSIRGKLDFYSALSASHIVPSKNTTYKGSDIRAAFKKYFGAEPELQCAPHAHNSHYILYQVSFCLRKDTLSVFECTSSVYRHTSCKDDDQVLYYPYL